MSNTPTPLPQGESNQSPASSPYSLSHPRREFLSFAVLIGWRAGWWIYLTALAIVVAYYFGFSRGDVPLIAHRAIGYARDIGVVVSMTVAAFGYGCCVLRALRFDSKEPASGFYAVSVGLGVFSLGALALGVTGLLYPYVLAAVIVIGIILAISTPFGRSTWNSSVAQVSNTTKLVGWDPLSIVALTVIGGTIVFAATANALVPPVDWDTIAYHFAIPRLYLENHGIFYIPYIVHSNWPFNFEMLYTANLALGSEIAPGIFNLFIFAVTVTVLTVEGARFYNIRSGLLAGAFYALIPDVQRYIGTGRVDGPMSLFGFLAIVALYQGLRVGTTKWFVLSGLLAGFTAGSKLTGASVEIVLGAILVVIVLMRRNPALDPRSIIIFAGTALLASAPWYVKSWIVTGNPVWPFLDSIFPSLNWDAYGSTIHNAYLHSTGTGTSFGSLLRLPWNLFATNRFGSPLGPLLLVFAPVAVLVRRERPLTALLVAFAALSSVVWFYLTQQPRFLSTSLLVFALLAGVGADYFLKQARPIGRLILSIGIAGWFLTQSPLALNRTAMEASLPFIRGQQSRDSFLSTRVDAYPVFAYANSHLPSNARIFLLLYEDRAFYLDIRYFWANPVAQRVVRFEQIPTDGDLARQLNDMGFTHVLVNPKWDLPDAPYANHFHALVADLIANHLDPIYSANGVTLYRLTR